MVGVARRAPQLRVLIATATDDCIIWPGPLAKRTGYPKIGKHGGHRMVCEWTHGPAPTPRHEAAHSCGTPACVNPRHLRWATRRENAADRRIHGTELLGEKNHAHRLTADQVREIRQRNAGGEQIKTLAAEFGVASSTVQFITSGHTWRHLLESEPAA